MSRRSAIAAALAALALVGAACGGTSKEDYEKEIDEIGTTLDEQFTEIGRDIQSSGGLENAAADVEKGADALDGAAAELEDLDPPDNAEDAHAKIVAGVHSLADDFRKAADAARVGDARTVLDLFGDIEASEGFKQIAAARKELARAGYDVDR